MTKDLPTTEPLSERFIFGRNVEIRNVNPTEKFGQHPKLAMKRNGLISCARGAHVACHLLQIVHPLCEMKWSSNGAQCNVQ